MAGKALFFPSNDAGGEMRTADRAEHLVPDRVMPSGETGFQANG